MSELDDNIETRPNGLLFFYPNCSIIRKIKRIKSVKEQPVQEYLTDSSGILGQINLKTLNNVHAIAPNIFAITFIKK